MKLRSSHLAVRAVAAVGITIGLALFGPGTTPVGASSALFEAAAARAAPADASYTVRDGDTLDGIAIALGVPHEDIADWVTRVVAINNLGSADQLSIGQVLLLPSGPNPKSGSTSTRAAAGSPADASYTVKDGDTLFGIAVRRGVPADQQWDWVAGVLSLNGLADTDVLSVGQVLKLPPIPPASTSSAPKSESRPTAPPKPDTMPVLPKTYTVQEGDRNLYDLARRFGIPESLQDGWVTRLVQLNRLDAKGMYAGNILQLPQ
jgi:LysM repeat protein